MNFQDAVRLCLTQKYVAFDGRARRPEFWWFFLFQLIVRDRRCLVRINGETVLDHDKLENLEPGSIELQAHQAGRWIEYKDIRVRRLGEPK